MKAETFCLRMWILRVTHPTVL